MLTKNTWCVYMHTFPNGMKYVGITEYGNDPNERWKNGFGYSRNYEMFYDIIQYGWKNIKHEILYNNLSEEAALKIEDQLIDELDLRNTGYNRQGGHKTYSTADCAHAIAVMCVETGQIYNSKSEAQRAVGHKNSSAFWKVVDNPNRTAGGCHWVTYNPENN